MKLNSLLISILLINPFSPRAQEVSSENIDKLYKLAYEYYSTDQEKALAIANTIIDQAKEIDYHKKLMQTYYLKGYILKSQGKLDQALINYFKSWETGLYINDQKEIIKSLKSIGKIYYTVGHYESAQVYYSDALSYSIKQADTMNIAIFNTMMGKCNMQLHQTDSALYYYHRAIDYYSSIDNLHQVAFVNNLIGNLNLHEFEDYEQSRKYYFKADKINREQGDETALKGSILNNIGYSYFKEENMVKAEEYYLKTVSLTPENKEMKYFKVVYNNLGALKLLSDNIKEAEGYFIKSEQANHSPVLEIERLYSYENLFKIYSTTNRGLEYLPYAEKLIAQSKELVELKDLLNKMVERYQLKLVEYQRLLTKERFERKIESERQISIIIIVSLSLLIILIVVFFTTKRFFFYRDKSREIKDQYNHFRTIYNDFIAEYRAAIATQLQLHRKLGTRPNTPMKGPWGENLLKNTDDDDD
ncbi:MAG: hypothetical protein O7F74_02270 [Bacteroidetes bacterium]|nr:hypothetical protein [Bacteroidota bacterium]